MKVFVVVFALVAAVSAWPYEQQYYESRPVSKYYGEPEEFVTSAEKPSTVYSPAGYRLVTAGQYDLSYDYQNGYAADGYAAEGYTTQGYAGYPQFNWQEISSI